MGAVRDHLAGRKIPGAILYPFPFLSRSRLFLRKDKLDRGSRDNRPTRRRNRRKRRRKQKKLKKHTNERITEPRRGGKGRQLVGREWEGR